MSFRTTSLLFGILLLILFGFGLMLSSQRRKLDYGYVLPTLAKENAPEIEGVDIDRGGDKVRLYKKDSGWWLKIGSAKEELRADAGTVEDLIRDLRKLRKSDEADITTSTADWGLDKPSGTVTLRGKGGQEWVLNLGRESPDVKGYVYVNSSDRPREVLAVRRGKIERALHDSPNKYRSLQLLNFEIPRTTSVQLQGGEKAGGELKLVRAKEGTWRFEKPNYGLADFEGSLDAKSPAPTGVRGLLTTLSGLSVPTPADFEPVGKTTLPEKAALLRVTVVSTEKDQPVTGVLLIGEQVPKKKQYYARLLGDEAVARVSADAVEPLLEFLKNPGSLRSRDLTQIDPGAANLVKVASGTKLANVVTLYKPGADWKVAAGDFRRKANESAVAGAEGLLAALQGRGKVKDFIDVLDDKQAKEKDKELGFDSPAARVEIYIDGLGKEEKKDPKKDEKKDDKKDDKKGEKKDEKKDDKSAKKDDKKGEKKEDVKPADEGPVVKKDAKPAVTLLFGAPAKDGGVNVKRIAADGTESRLVVPGSILEKVTPPEGALAYLDSNLSPFSELDVAQLKVERSDGTFVLEREQKKDKDKDKKDKDKKDKMKKDLFDDGLGDWLLVQPKDLPDRPKADRGEVNRVLDALTGMSARRWVKRVADKEDLSSFGLKSPALTVTVTLKKREGDKEAPAPYVYQFGREESPTGKGKEGVYGTIPSGTDLKGLIFVAAKEAFKTISSAEFRDRTVFTFDPKKVKEVKLTYVKPEETRAPVFERKGSEWQFKAGGAANYTFTPDSLKFEDFVRELAELKAVRWVSFKGAPDAKMELGAKAPLTIEVLMDDGKTQHTLTVGALLKDEGYYAQSAALPNAVFLVPQLRFGPVLVGATYFSRN